MPQKGQITRHEWVKVTGFCEHCPHCKTDMYWSFEHACYMYNKNGTITTECPKCIIRKKSEDEK
jgi:hypothetical protein